MKVRVNNLSKADLKKILNDLPRRMKNVATAVGRAVSEQTAEEVTKRLEGHGGWIADVYKKAITYYEDAEGGHWAVAGYAETRPDLFEWPAESSLLMMTQYPEDSPSSILANYQPWPIDVIPALTSAYPGKAEVRIYDPGTVSTYRDARLRNLPTVIAALNEVAQVDESEGALVTVERVYADVKYMAKRLELGFNGYPRVPHWGPASSALASSGERWATSPPVLRLIEAAVKGKEPGKVATMSPSKAEEFARIRKASWS